MKMPSGCIGRLHLKEIRADFDHIFEVSQEITEDTFRFTWHQSLIKEIMQLFAPML